MIYQFQKEDGTLIDCSYPMGTCPKEIKCDDGQKAIRVFTVPNISLFSNNGHASGDSASKLNSEMKKRQAAADKRMRERYKSCKETPLATN